MKITNALAARRLKYERGSLTPSERLEFFADLIRTQKILALPVEYMSEARRLITNRAISPSGLILGRR